MQPINVAGILKEYMKGLMKDLKDLFLHHLPSKSL